MTSYEELDEMRLTLAAKELETRTELARSELVLREREVVAYEERLKRSDENDGQVLALLNRIAKAVEA